MLNTRDPRLAPPRPDVERSPSRSPRRWRWLGVGVIAFAVVVSAIAFAGTRGSDDTATVTTGSGASHRYEGPQLAFDVPADWHQFYLSVEWAFSAAYGPIEGGDDDYVAVGPVPAEMSGSEPEEILGWGGSRSSWTGPVVTTSVNGMAGYSVPVHVRDVDGSVTLAIGAHGQYMITCSYGAHIAAEIRAGCDSITNSLVESAPPVVEDASGCSAAELVLMSAFALPAGTLPHDAEGRGTFEAPRGHVCDQMVEIGDHDGNVLDDYQQALEASGWTIESVGKDRDAVDLDVYRLVATKDWDVFMIELYVDDGAPPSAPGVAHHFFVTVSDG